MNYLFPLLLVLLVLAIGFTYGWVTAPRKSSEKRWARKWAIVFIAGVGLLWPFVSKH